MRSFFDQRQRRGSIDFENAAKIDSALEHNLKVMAGNSVARNLIEQQLIIEENKEPAGQRNPLEDYPKDRVEDRCSKNQALQSDSQDEERWEDEFPQSKQALSRNSAERKRKSGDRCRFNAKRYASKRRKGRKPKDSSLALLKSLREIFSLQKYQQGLLQKHEMSVLEEVEEQSSQSGKSSRKQNSGELADDRGFDDAANREAKNMMAKSPSQKNR